MGYYITSSTHFNHSRIARYLDVLNSRQHLQGVLDWVYIQEKVANVTQIVMQDLVETDSGEWEDTIIILDVSTPQLNPLAHMGVAYAEEKVESLPLQGPVEVQQTTSS